MPSRTRQISSRWSHTHWSTEPIFSARKAAAAPTLSSSVSLSELSSTTARITPVALSPASFRASIAFCNRSFAAEIASWAPRTCATQRLCSVTAWSLTTQSELSMPG